MSVMANTTTTMPAECIEHLDWQRIAEDLGSRGNAVVKGLLTSAECAELAGLYDDSAHFRSRLRSGMWHTLGMIFHDAR